MQRSRIPSPARSQGATTTPRRKKARSSRSLCSPALSTASGRLTSLIDQFKDKNVESFALSPLNGRSVLNDNTDIEEPRHKSWWKKLDDNSRDVMEVLEDNKLSDVNNVVEELDIEVLSQEKKNYTLDLPESSDNETIHSIVLPQRRLFTQKENLPQKKFGQLIDNRESLAKLHKPNTTNTEKNVNVGTRELFQNAKRSKPIFPAALVNISPNKTTADKTKENVLVEPKPQVRNIFGNRPANKRKNMFADFIVSESEDEIPEIQPKVFGFQKKLEQRRISSVSKGRDGSPTSSITTDMEMDDWKLLPSSTMVENQIEDMMGGNTPVKRARLSKLSEAKESDAGTNTLQTNTTADKTKQSNKSASSKDKSKASPEIKTASLNNSRTTRNMLKNASKVKENANTSLKLDSIANKSQTRRSPKGDSNKSPQKDKQDISPNKSQNLNKSKTRNSQIVLEDNVEADENIFNTVHVINNVTRVINKSTGKNMSSSTIPNKSVNEKERTVTLKVHSKLGTDGIEENKGDDENNFTLEYENDENEIIEEAVDHKDLAQNQKDKKQNTTLIKDSQETQMNKSKNNKSNLSNKSIQRETKPAKTVEESVESQNEQYSADDNVDGNVEQDPETVHNKTNDHEEEIEEANMDEVSKENVADQSEVDEANVSQDNDNDQNASQEVENEENESEEEEEAGVDSDENEEANESGLNEDDANESQEVEAEVNDSQEVEAEVNDSQEVDDQVNESHVDDDNDPSENEEEEGDGEKTVNESQVEDGNESQEVENDEEESQELENEAEVSQEVENDLEESQELENDEVSQELENDEEDNQELENDEEESHEIENDDEHEQLESDAEANESEEIDNDQQMEDSDEADKAIASDPEISEQDDDDDQADEMEVDDDNDEQESEHDQSHQEERQVEEQNEVEPSAEEIGESPNVTHDTTGRHRKKHLNKSPEVILHDKTTQMDSFAATGRNTSIRKTKSMIKNLHIRPSLAPPRNSTGFSDGATNSSAEGSGWDSHRTTRKTLRQTFGKDFTPRKSLRALVMEKSAKRQTEHIDIHSETVKFPQANSTELPEVSNHDDVEDFVESDHEVSRRTRQTTLEMYLEKIKQQNIEKKAKMEELVRNSLNKGPVMDPLSLFKVPTKPAPRRPKPSQAKPKKQIRSIIAFDDLPSEIKEDMKYKPPKRFQPSNASWITKRLYKFLETKLEPKYDYKARIRAEKLVETIYHFAKDLRRHTVAPTDAVDVLKHELARLEVVHTHFEFYEFFHEFMPREVRIKVVPDIVNKIPLPRHGVFSEILRGNTVQG